MPSGKNLIAGNWKDGEGTFSSTPASGPAHEFSCGTPALVAEACAAAEEAFASYGSTTRAQRAKFLNRIADEIEARGEALTEIAGQESGLPDIRLNGERGRTCGQLRMFADHILKGDYLDRRHDVALPDRQPLPRPDLKMIQRPIGPVAVFGASNFPLAFSTAGGDTASALAAGCPVVVKGHPAHPGTSELVAEAINAAREAEGLHPGVFSHVNDGGIEVGGALVTDPRIRAVGFTGGLAGGRALFDICASRPDPIPFFGELGSVNPVFVLPSALNARGNEIAAGWAGSLTMGAGQFCTNPGVVVLEAGDAAEAFIATAAAALNETAEQTMLTDGIAGAFCDGRDRIAAAANVEAVVTGDLAGRGATAQMFRTTGDAFLADDALAHEVFGPLGMVVVARDQAQVMEIAKGLDGQLTATLQMDEGDSALAAELLPVLERKAGRILANGFPTGVEVSDTMVHSGPYPASTNFGATSVGTLAIRRFLRPVCYQNLPDALTKAVMDA